MKKLTAILLALVLLSSCVSASALENKESKAESVVFTQSFCDNFNKLRLPGKDGYTPENIAKSGIMPFYEDENLLLFRYLDSDLAPADGKRGVPETYSAFGDYTVRQNTRLYGAYHDNKNICGDFVYTNGRIYSLRDAWEKDIVNLEKLLKHIPFTYKGGKLYSSNKYVNPLSAPDVSRIYTQAFRNAFPAEEESICLCYEDDDITVFRCLRAYDEQIVMSSIGNYTFSSGYTYRGYSLDNKTGDFVYKDGKVYSLKEASDEKIADLSKLAKYIPYTAEKGEDGVFRACCENNLVNFNPDYAKVPKKAQSIKLTAKVKTVRASKAKKSRQVITNAVTVKKNVGKLTYTKLSGSKKLTVTKSGKIVLKKGVYKKNSVLKIKVKINAGGSALYKTASAKVIAKIKIK